MSHDENAILMRCLELTEGLVNSEPPEWQTFARTDWKLEMDCGPRYAVSKWFGPQPERQRMRYRRAIDQLERRGLVVTHRAWGSRLSHLKLTHEGVAAAELLRNAETPSDG